MLEYILIFAAGIFAGYLISAKLRRTDMIGTLQIIESDELERPYIFLELDKDNVDEICEMHQVSMRVKATQQSSH